MRRDKKPRGKGSTRLERYYLYVILLFLLGSLFFNFFENKRLVRVKLCMKDKQSGKLVIQKRTIPQTSTTEEKIYWILRELASGPVDNKYEKILDPNIEIKNVIVRQSTAYVSFNRSFVDSLYENSSYALCSVTHSILLNIRELDGIKILIDGIEPVSNLSNLSSFKINRRSIENGRGS